MKNKKGTIIGFLSGFAGFLLLFKFLFLDRTSPEDELAPGMVVMAAVASGVVFALAGSLIENYFRKKNGKDLPGSR